MNRHRLSPSATLMALLLAVGLWPVLEIPAVFARQDAPPPVEAGAGPIGEPSLRLVGRVIYGEERVELFGYLTGATNLAAGALAVDALSGLSAARFTFRSELPISDRASRGDVRVLAGEGNFAIFLNETGGAAWDDPASFSAGTLVAQYAIRWRETLQRQDPTVGVVVGDATLTQEQAGVFGVAGGEYRFGEVGIASRLRYTGALTPAANSREVAASVAGFALVTDRAATPVPLGAGAGQ
jgi:hypothetical protein